MRLSFFGSVRRKAGKVPTAMVGPVAEASPDALNGSPSLTPPAASISLPAAPAQVTRPTGTDYLAALQGLARRPDQPIALSVSLPFCAVRCLCCDRVVSAAQSNAVLDDYVAGLMQEMQSLAECIGAGRDVVQVHLGGGSANELSESHLAWLVRAMRRHWRLPADADMSVECDPRRSGWMQLQVLRGLGFRQVTFGVLDLDPLVQRAIGRLNSPALIDDICQVARSCDIGSISLALMIGLPYQTPERWRVTLERLVDIAPERLRVTRYCHRPWLAPGQHAIDSDSLPDARQCEELAAMTVRVLGQAGYRCLDNELFVLETDELAVAAEQKLLRRNLIAHTATPAAPVLGLGAGALGELDGQQFWTDASVSVWREAVRSGHWPVAQVHAAGGRVS